MGFATAVVITIGLLATNTPTEAQAGQTKQTKTASTVRSSTRRGMPPKTSAPPSRTPSAPIGA
jgi:hypothetical protein